MKNQRPDRDFHGGPVRPDEWAFYEPLDGVESMLELGDKINGALGTYKAFFEGLGIRHVSIDWNGKNGALNRDLRKPLWAELGQFDCVTNIGTTEHVTGEGAQRAVWENIHRLLRPGGLLVSVTPKPGCWHWHGTHYPTIEFYSEFCRLNGYVIEGLAEQLPAPNTNIYLRARKGLASGFIMPAESLIYRNHMRPRWC